MIRNLDSELWIGTMEPDIGNADVTDTGLGSLSIKRDRAADFDSFALSAFPMYSNS